MKNEVVELVVAIKLAMVFKKEWKQIVRIRERMNYQRLINIPIIMKRKTLEKERRANLPRNKKVLRKMLKKNDRNMKRSKNKQLNKRRHSAKKKKKIAKLLKRKQKKKGLKRKRKKSKKNYDNKKKPRRI